MGSNPINLAVRLMLELIALVSYGTWGWSQHSSPLNYILAIALPIIFSFIWGLFAVPDDPSRSGKAPVPTNGLIRLIIELILFGFAVYAISQMYEEIYSILYGIIVLLHYVISYDRILWLLSRKKE